MTCGIIGIWDFYWDFLFSQKKKRKNVYSNDNNNNYNYEKEIKRKKEKMFIQIKSLQCLHT